MDARGNPAAARTSTRWKRVGIGCLAVLGLGGMLGLVAVGVFVKMRYPWIFDVAKAGQEAVKRGKSNPAIQELNAELCSEALLFSAEEVGRFERFLRKQGSGEAKPPDAHAPPPFQWILSCRVRDAARAPGCDRVAQTFHHASTDRGRFVVFVSAGLYVGAGKTLCIGLYDEDGKLVRHFRGDEGKSKQ